MEKFKQQKWIFKDREAVVSALFGIPITYALLCVVIIMLGIYILAWAIEGKILTRVIGFQLPLVIKIMSLISTLALFSFLIKSTGVLYFVIVSTFVYFVTHSLLLSGLLEFFFKCQDYDAPFFNMLYYKPKNYDYFFLIGICMVRVLLGLPFVYYSLVLFTMRRAGGTGYKRIPAFKLEKETIIDEMKKLKKRFEYVVKRSAIMEMY